jgi:hypothetical protein
VTTDPNAEWIALQLTEACGWRETPRHIVRDRDGAYGNAFIRRLAAMGIRVDRSRRDRYGKMDMRRGSLARSAGTASTMSWCSAKSIFVICSIRTKNIIMRSARTSRCARPVPRNVSRTGRVLSVPILGGLHHQYVRV